MVVPPMPANRGRVGEERKLPPVIKSSRLTLSPSVTLLISNPHL